MSAFVRALGFRLIERSLRRTFRQVELVGDWSPPSDDIPLILYANHQGYHDGYLLAWLLEVVLHRKHVVWMRERDRFPFFGAIGALPFPVDSAGRRAATIRRTAHAMCANGQTALLCFPEGHLHDPAERLLPFPEAFNRYDTLFPDHWWWPVAVRVTGFHQSHPTVQLTGGVPHRTWSGSEHETLQQLCDGIAEGSQRESRVLLHGAPAPEARWNFSALNRFFA